MSIFDNMSPDQIAGIFDIGASPYGTSANPLERGYYPGIEQEQFPELGLQPPEMPSLSSGQSDVSGFANFGMTPPPLPDPISQMGGLMGMMGDPHQNRKEDPFLQQQQGGLMAYLQQLGVV